MGFELPIDVDYPDHPKVAELIAMLGKKEADVFPLRLFLWAAKFAKSGVIAGGCKVIEKACRWPGKPGVLHAALIETGFIEEDGITIHDWMTHAGRKVAAYERKKERERENYRIRNSGETDRQICQNSAADSQPSKAEFRNLAPINETKRNETKRNEKETKRPPFGDFSISELAQKAAFLSGKGTKPTAISDWYATISDLISSGVSSEEIASDLEKTKGMNGSLKSEPPWDFKRRMLERRQPNSKPQKTMAELLAEQGIQ